MARSRTIRTLTALLVMMTLGAVMLMLMESRPPRPSPGSLAAVTPSGHSAEAVVFDTEVPHQPLKWRNIVVHASGAGRDGIAQRTHFVVDPPASDADGAVIATDLWKRQAEGHHVYVPWRDFNADSIGICLTGEFSSRPPSPAQIKALVSLVQTLQYTFSIPADRVYLHSDLDSRSGSPGDAFPAEAFTERLLQAAR